MTRGTQAEEQTCCCDRSSTSRVSARPGANSFTQGHTGTFLWFQQNPLTRPPPEERGAGLQSYGGPPGHLPAPLVFPQCTHRLTDLHGYCTGPHACSPYSEWLMLPGPAHSLGSSYLVAAPSQGEPNSSLTHAPSGSSDTGLYLGQSLFCALHNLALSSGTSPILSPPLLFGLPYLWPRERSFQCLTAIFSSPSPDPLSVLSSDTDQGAPTCALMKYHQVPPGLFILDGS